jgi:hypothetical protein
LDTYHPGQRFIGGLPLWHIPFLFLNLRIVMILAGLASDDVLPPFLFGNNIPVDTFFCNRHIKQKAEKPFVVLPLFFSKFRASLK